MNERRLTAFFEIEKKEIERRLPPLIHQLDGPASLKEAMLYSLEAGGKRIRPLLLLSTLQDLNTSKSAGYNVACAIEMLHTYSLIHDDLPAMDDDDFRRGKPTNHVKFGEALAILAGDALLTKSFEVVASVDDALISAKRKVELIRLFAKAAGPEGMVGGQVADLDGEQRELTLQQLQYIHHHKTGDLLTFSIVAGAIIAGATSEQMKLFQAFGKELGLVFQIKDDILDVEGDEKKLGKPVGSDSTKQKSTYPSLLTLDGAKKKLHEHTEKAKQYLAQLKLEDGLLSEITSYIAERNY